MPAQTNPDFENPDLAHLSQSVTEFFATASTPDEVAELRDELLRKVAECAATVRKEIAEAERNDEADRDGETKH